MDGNSKDKIHSDLSLKSLLPNNTFGSILKFFLPILERLLGIHKIRSIYLSSNLPGSDKQTFSKNLLNLFGIRVIGKEDLISKTPKEEACIIVCNHPYGMIEGVVIAELLNSFRSDIKILANVGLKVFKEIEDYFIFANPLVPKSELNQTAIKECYKHLENNGLLVIFPAGRVSYYRSDKKRITDGDWNRIAIQLSNRTNAPILPVFISGNNSRLFYCLGRIYYRFRLLMLIREMLKLKNHQIELSTSNLILPKSLSYFDSIKDKNSFVRAACYIKDKQFFVPWRQDNVIEKFAEIIPKVESNLMEKELGNLDNKQHLVNYKSFSVYYAYQSQVPNCVKEITRLREVVFRLLNEGSGQSRDTDKFDASYIHLFIFDHKHGEIIGAYRMGATLDLLMDGDLSKLYLSQMFDFDKDFVNRQQACLEMGRSFIVEEHQNSFYALMLLWKGIGAFVCQNPQYRTLYGTVSLSKLYDPRSVAIMDKLLVNDRKGVKGKQPFSYQLHPEMDEFLESQSTNSNRLSALIKIVEDDGKDIPILVKQYQKLGAKFHTIAIDNNFNYTPGLLLSVDLPSAPDKLLNLYLGDGKKDYLDFQE